VTHALRLRLIAPRSRRIEWIKKADNLNDYDATRKVDRVDEERRRWTRFFYDVDSTDASLYDLVINAEKMSVQDAADLATAAARLESLKANKESLATLADTGLRSRVLAFLITNPATADLDVDIVASGGKVGVGGLSNAKLLDEATQIVARVPGVVSVDRAR